MNLSKEMAVRLHRMMWSDMQKELGNDPLEGVRLKFKKDWVERNFPDALVMHNCFLCEYSFHQAGSCCSNCPIKWPEGHCNGTKFSYATAPISDILELPARSEESTLMKAYVEKSFNHAYLETKQKIAKASGLDDLCTVDEHIKAIQERAKEQMEPYVKSSMLLVDTLNKYKDFLSDESGLDRNRPVEDHIKEIWDDAFSDGRDYERERIMDKIGEMLNDKSAGTAKDS